VTDFPQQQGLPVTVTTYGRYGVGAGYYRFGAGGSAQCASFAVGATGNVATYCPLWLPFRYPAQNFFYANGTTANGTIDIGLYSQDGARIWSSGPTTQTGTSTLQFFAKDIVIDPGCYYLAVGWSSSTATGWGQALPTATRLRYLGLLQQTGLTSGTLPSPATFAAYAQAVHAIPLIGFTWQSGTPNF
jgi:hypothetical protein